MKTKDGVDVDINLCLTLYHEYQGKLVGQPHNYGDGWRIGGIHGPLIEDTYYSRMEMLLTEQSELVRQLNRKLFEINEEKKYVSHLSRQL